MPQYARRRRCHPNLSLVENCTGVFLFLLDAPMHTRKIMRCWCCSTRALFAAAVLLLLAGLADLPTASAVISTDDSWSGRRTTIRNAGTTTNSGSRSGRIVRPASDPVTLTIEGYFPTSTCNCPSCYRCVFVDPKQGAEVYRNATHSTSTTIITCPTPKDWGSQYDAAMVELRVQRNTAEKTGCITPVWETMEAKDLDGRGAYYIYLEEDIKSVTPTRFNSYNQTVTVIGSGFSPNKQYRCITFEGETDDTWTVQPLIKGWTNLEGFPFTRLNNTFGTCTVQTKFSARSTSMSIMNVKEVVNSLEYVSDGQDSADRGFGQFQPIVAEIRRNSNDPADTITWKGLPITWFDSWTTISTLSGLKTGGETLTVKGSGFKLSNPLGKYFCDFTLNTAQNSGCLRSANQSKYSPPILNSQSRNSSEAIVVDSQTLTCMTPGWGFNTPVASTVFKVRANTATGPALDENNVQNTSFDFVTKPVWSDDTPAEGTVYSEGVHCSSLTLNFRASGGLSKLRLTLDYTPLRPYPERDFLQWGLASPARSEVMFKSQDLATSYFVDSAKVDDIQSFGYCLGALNYTLKLPRANLPEKTTASYVAYNKKKSEYERLSKTLGIVDNEGEPSNLVLKTMTAGDVVQGELSWNVSRGWEGYGYKLCVTARHALSLSTIITSDLFAKRCIFVVVPKCLKCYAPFDDLSSIAMGYGATWLDLWTVNLNLTNTTAVRKSSDEVFNTAKDQIYPQIAPRQLVRLGLAYRARPGDTLEGVGTRFGMSIRNLMQLNPDIVAANQNAKMGGKQICILPSTAQYSECERQVENPDPNHFEATYRAPFFYEYGQNGEPIKSYNPRYPQPPFAPPTQTPAQDKN